jgi:hypothetical protein
MIVFFIILEFNYLIECLGISVKTANGIAKAFLGQPFEGVILLTLAHAFIARAAGRCVQQTF